MKAARRFVSVSDAPVFCPRHSATGDGMTTGGVVPA